ESIREGLRNCDWFLVVLSPNSVGSKWVRREVHWAMERREGHVVPVLIEDCMPEDLHLGLFPIQLVDFRYDKEKAQAKLLAIWGASKHWTPITKMWPGWLRKHENRSMRRASAGSFKKPMRPRPTRSGRSRSRNWKRFFRSSQSTRKHNKS